MPMIFRMSALAVVQAGSLGCFLRCSNLALAKIPSVIWLVHVALSIGISRPAPALPRGSITGARLRRIEAVEDILGRMGFRMLRVRDHGKLARIEVGADEIALASSPDMRRKIMSACISNGYVYACVDLAGYRTGSMNEALPEAVIRQLMEGTDSVPAAEDTSGSAKSMSCCC